MKQEDPSANYSHPLTGMGSTANHYTGEPIKLTFVPPINTPNTNPFQVNMPDYNYNGNFQPTKTEVRIEKVVEGFVHIRVKAVVVNSYGETFIDPPFPGEVIVSVGQPYVSSRQNPKYIGNEHLPTLAEYYSILVTYGTPIDSANLLKSQTQLDIEQMALSNLKAKIRK